MKAHELFEIKQEVVEGTSCLNCTFTRGEEAVKVEEKELNKNGGIRSTDLHDLAGAKKADVITMPGKDLPTVKKWCKNTTVDQWVTERMCCNLWEAPGILTEYK